MIPSYSGIRLKLPLPAEEPPMLLRFVTAPLNSGRNSRGSSPAWQLIPQLQNSPFLAVPLIPPCPSIRSP